MDQKVWFGSNLGIKFPETPTIQFQEWITSTILDMNGQVSAQVVSIAYTIWHARNISIHENQDLPEEEIIKRAQTCMEEYQQANNGLQDVRWVVRITHFRPIITTICSI